MTKMINCAVVLLIIVGFVLPVIGSQQYPFMQDNQNSVNTTMPLKILYQGGDVPGNIIRVLLTLHKLKGLELERYRADEDETLEQIFAEKLELPKSSPLIIELANRINGKQYVPAAFLSDGEIVLYPVVKVKDLEVVKAYNLAVQDEANQLNEDREKWAGYIKEEVKRDAEVELKLTAYQMEELFTDPAKLNEAIDEINKSQMPGVRVITPKAAIERAVTTFAVGLEGGDTDADALKVLRILLKMKLIDLKKHVVKEGEEIDTIYKQKLNLPISIIDLANELNATDYRKRKLNIGDEVIYPDASFTEYIWTKVFNLKSERDQNELAHLRQKWKHVIKGEAEQTNEIIQLRLAGYRLILDAGTKEKLAESKTALAELPSSKNIVLSFPESRNSDQPRFFSYSKREEDPVLQRDIRPADKWWTDCCVSLEQLDKGVQGWQGAYINLKDVPTLQQNCAGNLCPEIVLLDQPVDATHPDIAAAIIDDSGEVSSAPSLVDEGTKKQKISPTSFEEVKDKEHGTHLAGIIASQDNDFGLIGINPRARIYSMNWLNLRPPNEPYALADKIQERALKKKFQIWVFASEWPLALKKDELPDVGDQQFSGDMRFQDLRAKRIKGTSSLWVVSAGDSAFGRPVSRSDLTAPMNLGDLPNVIVVTACEGCYTKSPHLMPKANFSIAGERAVHIAGPGEEITSTVGGGGGMYARSKGTSQATAFVAGVASLMTSGYPTHYHNAPYKIKFRLQVTSKPLLSGAESSKVAAGILDPVAALLDPDENYADTNTGSLDKLEPSKWCARNLEFRDASGKTLPVPTTNIRRMFRVPSQQTWVVYYTENPLQGELLKFGPANLVDPAVGEPLLISGKEVYTPSNLMDVILTLDGLKTYPTKCPEPKKKQ
jgi:Subtilase family